MSLSMHSRQHNSKSAFNEQLPERGRCNVSWEPSATGHNDSTSVGILERTGFAAPVIGILRRVVTQIDGSLGAFAGEVGTTQLCQ